MGKRLKAEITDHSRQALADRMRLLVLEMVHWANSGHVGSSLSCVDIIAALRFGVMAWDPQPPRHDSDLFVMSKGHAAPAWYASLLVDGTAEPGLMKRLRDFDSPFQGHVDRVRCPWVDVSTGALGQGLSVSIGRALGKRAKGMDQHVYCLLGDGECQEGQVWEAAMYAGFNRLSNLTAIIDYNKKQSDGAVDKTLSLEPLAEKWLAFGWRVEEIDGHDDRALMAALQAGGVDDRPSLVIAHTTKGYLAPGQSFRDGAHAGVPDRDEIEQAREMMGLPEVLL